MENKNSNTGCWYVIFGLLSLYILYGIIRFFINLKDGFIVVLLVISIIVLIYLVRKAVQENEHHELLCLIGRHTWGNWVYLDDKTCLLHNTCFYCDKTNGEKKVEHLWIDKTIDSSKCLKLEMCQRCDLTKGELFIKHNWSMKYLYKGKCDQQEACSDCGLKKGKIYQTHTWKTEFESIDTNKKITWCPRCKQKKEPLITTYEWPWIFSSGKARSLFLEVRNSFNYLVSRTDFKAYLSPSERITSTVGVSTVTLPQTNFQVPQFQVEEYEISIFPEKFILSKSGYSIHNGFYEKQNISFNYQDIPIGGDLSVYADVVGSSWLYTRQDGEPDQRYSYNPKIPIVRFAQLLFEKNNYEFLALYFSNHKAALEFYNSLSNYVKFQFNCNWSAPEDEYSKAENQKENQSNDNNSRNNEQGKKEESDGYRPLNGEMTTDEAYEVLEINKGASKMEIKAAYRKKSLEYHPDRVNHLGRDLKFLADQKMKEINGAYALLNKLFPDS